MKKLLLILFSAFFSLGSFHVGKHDPNNYRVPSKLTPEQIVKLYKQGKITKGRKNKILRARVEKINKIVSATEEKIAKITETAESEDPFYFYKPSTGEITPEKLEFLKKYLKPEDIPARFDSQIDVHMCKAPIRGVLGGNQSGKTTGNVIEDYIQGTGELPLSLRDIYPEDKLPKEFPQRIRVIGLNTSVLDNTLIPAYQKWVPRNYLKNGKWEDSFSAKKMTLFLYDPKTRELKASYEFKTDEQKVSSFGGPALHKVSYDEETTNEIYTENLLRFSTTDVNIQFGFTPISGMRWASYFSDDKDECGREITKIQLCSVTNPKCNLNALGAICDEILRTATTPEDGYKMVRMRILGDFISLSGMVYGKLFNKSIHVIPPFYENLDEAGKRDFLCISGWDPHGNTASAIVYLLVDKDGNKFVDLCYSNACETGTLKKEYRRNIRERRYHMGWSAMDVSANTTYLAFGGRNIKKELTEGVNAVYGVKDSSKAKGARDAGVDLIKRCLIAATKVSNGEYLKRDWDKPLYIIDRPDNRELVKSFLTMERKTYPNEERRGPQDEIQEGKHHFHAALRYIFQFPVFWYDVNEQAPEPDYFDEESCWA
jgi:hypothetical protein